MSTMAIRTGLVLHGAIAVGEIFINIPRQFSLITLTSLGPYGEQDDEQLFVQQIVPDSDELYVRLASTGKR